MRRWSRRWIRKPRAGGSELAALLTDGIAKLDRGLWDALHRAVRRQSAARAREPCRTATSSRRPRPRCRRPLYNNPQVWQAFGFEGASFDEGGYIMRGFEDLGWLPVLPRGRQSAGRAVRGGQSSWHLFDLNDDSVVVVIGSGAGGGTLSNELCQKGVNVVLPRGRPRLTHRRLRQRFDMDPSSSSRWLDKRDRHWRVAKTSRICRLGLQDGGRHHRPLGRRVAALPGRTNSEGAHRATAISPAPICSTGR